MKITVDKIEPIKSVLLCKLNRVPIGELPTSCVISQERWIDDVSQLTLRVNKYIVAQDSKKKIVNPLYDELKCKRYIFLNDKEYFIIDTISENKLSNLKEVVCRKAEQKLNRMLININEIYVSIFNSSHEDDIYSLEELLNEIGWGIEYADDSVVYEIVEEASERIRWQDSIDTNWLEFLNKDISQQFDCYIAYNTIDKKISIYDMKTLGDEIKIVLSKDNYIKSKTKEYTSENLITLLKLQGNEELNISEYLPSGYDFLMNFSYFKETKEMSDELISALNKYDEMVEIRSVQWRELITEKAIKEGELALNQTRWQISVSTMNALKTQIKTYALKEDVVNENRVRVKLSEETDNELILRKTIENLTEEIELLRLGIENINILCKFETATDENGNLIFNEILLKELSEFIFIDVYSDDSFVDGDEMLLKGESELRNRCRPTFEVNIDSVNFMNRIVDNKFRYHWNGELEFGDIIILLDDETKEEEYYYFVSYSIDYEGNQLNLKISNKKANRDNAKTINKLLKEYKDTKLLLKSNKYLFNVVKNNRMNIDRNDVQ